MGTEITLDLGNLNINYGKNEGWFDHSPLFQAQDVKTYIDKCTGEHGKEVYIRKLREVVPRLELLGYSIDSLRRDFVGLVVVNNKCVNFQKIVNVFRRTTVSNASRRYYDNEEGIVDPWIVLRLLALNKVNLDIPLTWNFHDWVENGWGNRDWIVHDLPDAERFLLLTEGKSDADILKKAFALLRPGVADFFRFADMQNHPFKGVGGLHDFCRGLMSVGNSNFTLAIYDNDTVGMAKMNETKKLQLPKNMRVMKLPDLKDFRRFTTLGTNGERKENINAKAVAIECFLDLKWQEVDEPKVRWAVFDEKSGKYQGALNRKHEYAKRFLKLGTKESAYSFDKLEYLLDAIIGECNAIAGDSRRHAWNQVACNYATTQSSS